MDIEGNADDFEEPDFVELQESPTNTLLQHEGPIDHERVIHLISIGEWEEVLVLLTKDMDPWNIDLLKLNERFSENIQRMRETNLRIPARILLAAAIIYRLKSETLYFDSSQNEDAVLDTPGVDLTIDWSQANVILPPIQLPLKRMPRRSVTLDELVRALEKAMVVKNRRETRDFFQVELAGEDHSVKIEQLFEKINNFLAKIGFINFSQLLPPYRTKEDIVRTFSGILHLSNQERLSCEQPELFGEIAIKPFTGQVAYEENANKRESYKKKAKGQKSENNDDAELNAKEKIKTEEIKTSEPTTTETN